MTDGELRPLVDCNSGSWRDWRNRLILAGGVDCESWCNSVFACGSRRLWAFKEQDDKKAILEFTSEGYYCVSGSSLVKQLKGQLSSRVEPLRVEEGTWFAEYMVSVETLNEIQNALLELLDYFLRDDFYEQPPYGIKVDTGKVGIEFTRSVAPDLQNFTDICVWVGHGGFLLAFAIDMYDFRQGLFEWLSQDRELMHCGASEEDLLDVYFSLEQKLNFADKIVID